MVESDRGETGAPQLCQDTASEWVQKAVAALPAGTEADRLCWVMEQSRGSVSPARVVEELHALRSRSLSEHLSALTPEALEAFNEGPEISGGRETPDDD